MLTSIILSIFVLAGIVFLLACLRGFHRALAGGRPVQALSSQVLVEHLETIQSERRVIPFPKGETPPEAGEAESKRGQRIATTVVAGTGM